MLEPINSALLFSSFEVIIHVVYTVCRVENYKKYNIFNFTYYMNLQLPFTRIPSLLMILCLCKYVNVLVEATLLAFLGLIAEPKVFISRLL